MPSGLVPSELYKRPFWGDSERFLEPCTGERGAPGTTPLHNHMLFTNSSPEYADRIGAKIGLPGACLRNPLYFGPLQGKLKGNRKVRDD